MVLINSPSLASSENSVFKWLLEGVHLPKTRGNHGDHPMVGIGQKREAQVALIFQNTNNDCVMAACSCGQRKAHVEPTKVHCLSRTVGALIGAQAEAPRCSQGFLGASLC